ncbi:MAG TPA: ATP-binding cassette domain-containing protein [Acidimicrobiales bacterium]
MSVVRRRLGDHEADGAGEGLASRERSPAVSLMRSLAPAAAILVAQQVIFPAPSGIVVRGLVVGGLTALVALGMALVFRANRIINFAQADLGLAPTVLAFLLIERSGLPWAAGLAIGLAAAVALGALTDRLLIGRLARSPRLLVTIATIGLSQLLVAAGMLIPRAWDITFVSGRLAPPFDITRQIGGVTFGANDLIALLMVPVVLVAVAAFLQRSDAGVAIRASADRPERAALAGVPVRRLQTLVWAVAGGLAFLAVFARSGILDVPTGSALGFGVLLRALVALLLGRMTNLVTIVSAAVALGALELGIDWGHGSQLIDPVLAAIVALTLVLRRRPDLRGSDADTEWKATDEVRPIPARLSDLTVVRGARWAWLGLVAAGAVALPQVLDIDQQFKAAALVIYAILGLSLVLLSGWLGTISLGQIAFFALGAAVAGWAIGEQGFDLIPAMALAAVVGAVAGLVVAVPTLRLRGLYLAITTFAFALATTSYLLDARRFGWVPTERIERVPLLGGFRAESEQAVYYVALAVLAIVLTGLRGVRRSRFGRVLVALRDNPQSAEAYAVDGRRVRLAAFALSGAVAGLAGALFMHHQQVLDSSSYGPLENLVVLTMVVIGGLTSLAGAVVGALFLLGTRWFLATEWQYVTVGGAVLVILLLAPNGIVGLLYGLRDRALLVLAHRRGVEVAPAAEDEAAEEQAAEGEVAEREVAERRVAGPTGHEPVGAGAPAVPGEHGESRARAALEVRDLCAGYGGAPVVDGVDLVVGPGDAVALLGTNGAGKSTVLRAISGIVAPEAGTVRLGGRSVTGAPAHRIAAMGLSHMPGGAGVFPSLTVDENLRVASWLRRHDRQGQEAAIAEMRTMFPVLAERASSRAGDLSGGQQQMLALAMAVLPRPKVLMIDELSLGLAPAVVAELLAMVGRLRAEGTTLVVVEQSVNLALEVADRAVFLERGRVRFSGPAGELLNRPDLLRSVFLGSAGGARQLPGPEALGGAEPAGAQPAPSGPASPPTPVLESIGLSVRFGGVDAVRDVSVALEPHEILGVIGPNGAGKTTLFDALSGVVAPTAGRVVLGGHDVTGLRPPARARRGLGRSFQDARLFPSLTVDEAIAVACERWVEVGDPLSAALRLPNAIDSEWAVARRVDELVELLNLADYRSLFVRELSTGTRRVLDLACLLAHRPSVVLLDEPASGLAQREVEQLGPLIRRIRDETGASLVIVEHDIPLVAAVSNRLVAMDRGRVIAVGAPGEVLAEPAVVTAYLGSHDATVQRSGAKVP